MVSTVLQLLVSGLLLGGVYALMSSGFSLVYGVMRVGNASHAVMAIFGTYIAYDLWRFFNIDPVIGMFVSMIIVAVVNIPILKYLVVRLVKEELLSYVMLYGVGIIIQNSMIMYWGSRFDMISPSYAGLAFDVFGIKISYVRALSSVIALLILGFLFWFLNKTFFGKAISATAQSKKGAQLVGVNLEHIYIATFSASAALGAAGGVLMGTIYAFQPGSAILWMSKIMAITIFGGLGNVLGTLLAAMILGVVELFIMHQLNPMWVNVFSYSILIATFIFRPWGLLGREYRER